MQVVKRDGTFAEYDRTKIAVAIGKANADVEESERASEKEIKEILEYIEHKNRKRMLVEDIQDIIEERLMAFGHYELAKKYLKHGFGAVLTFRVKGGFDAAAALVSKLELTVHYAEALTNIRCYIGEATKAGWMCWAGTAIDNERLVTDATRMATDVADSTKLYAFYAFPTVVDPPVPVTMLGAQPRATEEAGEWKLFFLSDYMDGDEQKTVRHTFTIEKNPLRVGEVFRGEFSINTTSGEYHDVETGIEVDPDWNPGHGTDVEL